MPPCDRCILAAVQRLQPRIKFRDGFIHAGNPPFLHGHQHQRAQQWFESGRHIRTLRRIAPRENHVPVPHHATAPTHQRAEFGQLVRCHAGGLRCLRRPAPSGKNCFGGWLGFNPLALQHHALHLSHRLDIGERIASNENQVCELVLLDASEPRIRVEEPRIVQCCRGNDLTRSQSTLGEQFHFTLIRPAAFRLRHR